MLMRKGEIDFIVLLSFSVREKSAGRLPYLLMYLHLVLHTRYLHYAQECNFCL